MAYRREFANAQVFAAAVLAVLPAALLLAGCRATSHKHAVAMLPTLALFLVTFWLIGGLAVLIVAASACFRRERVDPTTRAFGWGALLAVALYFASAAPASRLRMAAFAELARETEPLVAAIRAYEKQHEAPPPKLDDLIPRYLPRFPAAADGTLYYREGEAGGRDLHGNRWASIRRCGWGLSFDSFVYFPNRKYPRAMYGGGVERVGDWAYVHE